MISIVTFLSGRELLFKEDTNKFDSLHIGNYLRCLELLTEYYPFHSVHVRMYENAGKENVL